MCQASSELYAVVNNYILFDREQPLMQKLTEQVNADQTEGSGA